MWRGYGPNSTSSFQQTAAKPTAPCTRTHHETDQIFRCCCTASDRHRRRLRLVLDLLTARTRLANVATGRDVRHTKRRDIKQQASAVLASSDVPDAEVRQAGQVAL